jgi:dCMP deaminase
MCQAVHAELNALMDCRDVTKIHACYVTTLPCNNCMKSLLNTSCQRIVYLEDHDHADHVISEWTKAGRKVEKLT